MGSRGRQWLNQPTHSRVAYSTSSKFLRAPRLRMTSVLKTPMIDSARASYESPREPAATGHRYGMLVLARPPGGSVE